MKDYIRKKPPVSIDMLCWVLKDDKFISGIISDVSITKSSLSIKCNDGLFVKFSFDEEDLKWWRRDDLSQGTRADNTALKYLNPPNVLNNIVVRYKDAISKHNGGKYSPNATLSDIYTSTGWVLLAMNPYCSLPIYSKSIMDLYFGRTFTAVPPHPFAVAESAYQMLRTNKEAQVVVVTGESGAGKTETAKQLMEYLAYVSERVKCRNEILKSQGILNNKQIDEALTSQAAAEVVGDSKVAAAVLGQNIILEAFGNAKTTRNDNSSRFGKLTKLHFDSNAGFISKAAVEIYLLSKSRAVHVPTGERNFHILYSILDIANSGANPSSDHSKHSSQTKNLPDSMIHASSAWQLHRNAPEHWRLLRENNGLQRTGSVVNGDTSFTVTAIYQALRTGGLSEAEVQVIFRTLAAILHLGNVEFEMGDSEEVANLKSESDRTHLHISAQLFGIDGHDFHQELTTRLVRDTRANRTPQQAEQARDSIIKSLYGRLFDLVVARLNHGLARVGSSSAEVLADDGFPVPVDGYDVPLYDELDSSYVAVLDIFGFEDMLPLSSNSLEQLCINFCNERLHHHFLSEVLIKDAQTYLREGVPAVHITPNSNYCILRCIGGKDAVAHRDSIRAKYPSPSTSTDEEQQQEKEENNNNNNNNNSNNNVANVEPDAIALQKAIGHTDFSKLPSMGILQVLEDVTRAPLSGPPSKKDESFARRVASEVRNLWPSILPRTRDSANFAVRHFAGQVEYSSQGFVEKNADAPSDFFDSLVHRTSGCPWITSALCSLTSSSAGGSSAGSAAIQPLESLSSAERAIGSAPPSQLPPRSALSEPVGLGQFHKKLTESNRGGPSVRSLSIGMDFLQRTSKLMSTLQSASGHFIRCIKPNDMKKAGVVDLTRLEDQLRVGSVNEVLMLMGEGYPCRIPYDLLWNSYGKYLPASIASRLSPKDFAELVLSVLGVSSEGFALGTTRAFFKLDALERMEELKARSTDPEWLQSFAEQVIAFRKAKVMLRLKSRLLTSVKMILWLRHARAKKIADNAKIHFETVVLPRRRNNAQILIAKNWKRCITQFSYDKKKIIASLTQKFWRGFKARKEARKLRGARNVVCAWESVNTSSTFNSMKSCATEWFASARKERASRLAQEAAEVERLQELVRQQECLRLEEEEKSRIREAQEAERQRRDAELLAERQREETARVERALEDERQRQTELLKQKEEEGVKRELELRVEWQKEQQIAANRAAEDTAVTIAQMKADLQKELENEKDRIRQELMAELRKEITPSPLVTLPPTTSPPPPLTSALISQIATLEKLVEGTTSEEVRTTLLAAIAPLKLQLANLSVSLSASPPLAYQPPPILPPNNLDNASVLWEVRSAPAPPMFDLPETENHLAYQPASIDHALSQLGGSNLSQFLSEDKLRSVLREELIKLNLAGLVSNNNNNNLRTQSSAGDTRGGVSFNIPPTRASPSRNIPGINYNLVLSHSPEPSASNRSVRPPVSPPPGGVSSSPAASPGRMSSLCSPANLDVSATTPGYIPTSNSSRRLAALKELHHANTSTTVTALNPLLANNNLTSSPLQLPVAASPPIAANFAVPRYILKNNGQESFSSKVSKISLSHDGTHLAVALTSSSIQSNTPLVKIYQIKPRQSNNNNSLAAASNSVPDSSSFLSKSTSLPPTAPSFASKSSLNQSAPFANQNGGGSRPSSSSSALPSAFHSADSYCAPLPANLPLVELSFLADVPRVITNQVEDMTWVGMNRLVIIAVPKRSFAEAEDFSKAGGVLGFFSSEGLLSQRCFMTHISTLVHYAPLDGILFTFRTHDKSIVILGADGSMCSKCMRCSERFKLEHDVSALSTVPKNVRGAKSILTCFSATSGVIDLLSCTPCQRPPCSLGGSNCDVKDFKIVRVGCFPLVGYSPCLPHALAAGPLPSLDLLGRRENVRVLLGSANDDGRISVWKSDDEGANLDLFSSINMAGDDTRGGARTFAVLPLSQQEDENDPAEDKIKRQDVLFVSSGAHLYCALADKTLQPVKSSPENNFIERSSWITPGHTGRVTLVTAHAKSGVVVSVDDSGTMVVWKVVKGSKAEYLSGLGVSEDDKMSEFGDALSQEGGKVVRRDVYGVASSVFTTMRSRRTSLGSASGQQPREENSMIGGYLPSMI